MTGPTAIGNYLTHIHVWTGLNLLEQLTLWAVDQFGALIALGDPGGFVMDPDTEYPTVALHQITIGIVGIRTRG